MRKRVEIGKLERTGSDPEEREESSRTWRKERGKELERKGWPAKNMGKKQGRSRWQGPLGRREKSKGSEVY